MIKIIYRFFLFIILLFVLSITYLSTIGIKTEKFNSNISKQIKKIDENLDIRLKKISIILNPFKFTIKTKTIGTDLVYRDKIIQLESIRSNISIKSLINNRFSLTKVNISTKSLNIKNVISFIQEFPKELALDKYIDYDLQFNKAFLDPMKVILDAIGWNVKKTVNLELKHIFQNDEDMVKEPFSQNESIASPNFDKYCKNLKHMFGEEQEKSTKYRDVKNRQFRMNS